MPADLIGELEKSTLLDLVKPLLDGKKSGMVLVKGDEVGELHIEGGEIVHAKTRSCSGEEAIFAMIEWRTGRVTFDWKAIADQRTVSMATDQLVLNWTSREQEWKRIRELIPASNVIFRMQVESSPEGRLVQADQWRVLALSTGTRTVSEVADTLGWDLFKTFKTIYFMVQAGLLEKASEKMIEQKPPLRRYINGNFFSTIENELKRAMGPIATIIVDDTVAEFGASRDTCPLDRTEPLVQAISEEIADKVKRTEFVRAMTEFLARKQT